MKHRTFRILAVVAVLLPAGAWAAGILGSFRLSAHHPFKGGYVLNYDPSAPLSTPYSADPTTSYNVSLGGINLERLSTGFYSAKFDVLGHRPGNSYNFGANVQVTAFYDGLPVSCMTQGWETFFDDPQITVYVTCINTTTGALTDNRFSLLVPF